MLHSTLTFLPTIRPSSTFIPKNKPRIPFRKTAKRKRSISILKFEKKTKIPPENYFKENSIYITLKLYSRVWPLFILKWKSFKRPFPNGFLYCANIDTDYLIFIKWKEIDFSAVILTALHTNFFNLINLICSTIFFNSLTEHTSNLFFLFNINPKRDKKKIFRRDV